MIQRIVATALVLAAAPADAESLFSDGGMLDYKRLYFRGGMLHVEPLSDSRELELSGVHGPASLSVMDGPIRGSGAALDPVTVPAMIAGYVVPGFKGRLSLETVLALPLHVTFRATGTLAEESIAPDALGIPTGVPALGSELGEAEAAPPLVTAVYRLYDFGPLTPYAGAGISVLVAYNARATNPVLSEVAEPRFTVDPAPGLVLQTGLDAKLWRSVYARVDVKYIALMKAHATVENIKVRTSELPLFEMAEVGSATMEMWVNPLIVQVGLGVDL